VALNFVQSVVAAGLGARNHSVNALAFIEMGAKSLGHDCVHAEAR
jgi:hypothetical protein